MDFGYLADMVATIPRWFALIVKHDDGSVPATDGREGAGVVWPVS